MARAVAVFMTGVTFLGGLFILLERWEAAAEFLNIPRPVEVIERITGKPPALNMFNPGVESGMDSASVVASQQPLPAGCTESVRLRTTLLSEGSGSEDGGGPVSRSSTPIFVLIDSTKVIDNVTIGPAESVTSPRVARVNLEFIVGNSGRYGSVVLDNIDLDVTRTDALTPSEVDMLVRWYRPGEVPFPKTDIQPLELQARLTAGSQMARVDRPETGSAELNFELKSDEKVSLSIELSLVEPGLYSVTPTVLGFSNGERFQQFGPPMSFGWTRLSSHSPGSQDLSTDHAPECVE